MNCCVIDWHICVFYILKFILKYDYIFDRNTKYIVATQHCKEPIVAFSWPEWLSPYIACRVYKRELCFCSVHFVIFILYRPDELDATLFPPIEPDSGHSYIATFCGLTLGSRWIFCVSSSIRIRRWTLSYMRMLHQKCLLMFGLNIGEFSMPPEYQKSHWNWIPFVMVLWLSHLILLLTTNQLLLSARVA